MKVAVTGAHGFIGSHVVDEARAASHDVVAVLSPWGDPARLAGHADDDRVELRRADVTDVDSLRGAFADCDAVVHTAALVADYGRWERFHRVNVGGTEKVVDEARRSGIERVVLVSSVAVWQYTGIAGDDPRTRPRDQQVLPYGRSKLLAEDVVAGAPEPVVVRPALWPYGNRDPNLMRVASALRRGVLPLVDGGSARLQTVDAAFLARVLVTVCDHPAAPGRAYLAADPGAPTWRALFTEMAALLGVAAPRLSLPGAVLQALAPAVEFGWVAARLPGEPPLTRYRAGLMRRDVVFDAGAVSTELGLQPRRSRSQAMTVALTGAHAPPGARASA